MKISKLGGSKNIIGGDAHGFSIGEGELLVLNGVRLGGGGSYQTLIGDDLSAYQVPSGKVLKILAMKIVSDGGSNDLASLDVGYGDDSVSGGSRPTNAEYVNIGARAQSSLHEPLSVALNVSVPEDKYPYYGFVSSNFDSLAQFFCRLEDA
jgi:hypothetical protein